MNEILFRLIGLIVKVISPELRVRLLKYIAQLEADAKETTNDWDDILVVILKAVLNIK